MPRRPPLIRTCGQCRFYKRLYWLIAKYGRCSKQGVMIAAACLEATDCEFFEKGEGHSPSGPLKPLKRMRKRHKKEHFTY